MNSTELRSALKIQDSERAEFKSLSIGRSCLPFSIAGILEKEGSEHLDLVVEA